MVKIHMVLKRLYSARVTVSLDCVQKLPSFPPAEKYEEYQVLSSRVQEGDVQWLEQRLRAHISGESPMASLKSRLAPPSVQSH